MSPDELRALRARRQLLHRPDAGAPGAIVRTLLAVQAQDARAASDTEADPGLVMAWLMRGTLHLVGREDHPWLLALSPPTVATTNRRRLSQEGVPPGDAERAGALIERALGEDGPLTRAQLAERVATAGIRTTGQAMPHILLSAALRGAIVLGLGGRFERAQPSTPVDRGAALAELARRWLVAHGPASERDLAAWSGLPLRDARAGLAAIASDLHDAGDGRVDLAGASGAGAAVGPRLLPAFDPYLLGWRDRSFAVAPEHARRVQPGGGMFRAVATLNGRAVGTWTAPKGRVALELFDAATGADRFAEEMDDVARYLSG